MAGAAEQHPKPPDLDPLRLKFFIRRLIAITTAVIVFPSCLLSQHHLQLAEARGLRAARHVRCHVGPVTPGLRYFDSGRCPRRFSLRRFIVVSPWTLGFSHLLSTPLQFSRVLPPGGAQREDERDPSEVSLSFLLSLLPARAAVCVGLAPNRRTSLSQPLPVLFTWCDRVATSSQSQSKKASPSCSEVQASIPRSLSQPSHSMHENPEPNTAVPCDSFSSSPSGVTTRAVYGERSYQSYDDFRDSVLVPPALTTQNPGEAPLLLEQRHVPSAPRHRRANTEVITRQPSLLGNQDLVEKKNYSSHARAESLSSKFEAGGRTLVNWFQGKSGPVNLGLPSSTPATMSDNVAEKRSSREICEPPVRTVPTNRLQKRMTHPSPLKQVTTPTHTRSFSWFSKRQEEKEPELPEPADDEFLNLDVEEVLFPSGSGEQSEAQKFEQLQANAENIIRQLQAAYKQRTFALHAALTEKNERQEELDEARTRIQHIKSQLDGMAEKVLEQDKAIKAMAEELEQEREARKREEEARLRSVKSSDTDSITDLGSDLATPKRSKRASAATFNSHDSGFESGDESSAESVFSKRNETIESPVTVEAPSLKSKSSQITLPVPQPPAPQAPPKESKPLPPPPQQSPQKPPQRPPQPRPSAYDRVIRGLTSTGLTGAFIRGSSKCSNCYGVPASEAWSVVGILKEENTGLKERISELEDVIEDCLGIVGP